MKSSLPGKLCNYKHTDLMVIDNKNPFNKYRYWINNTIPYLKTLEGETIRPHLNIIYKNATFNEDKDKTFSLYLFNRIWYN